MLAGFEKLMASLLVVAVVVVLVELEAFVSWCGDGMSYS